MKIITRTTDILPEPRFDLDSVLFFDIESTGLSKEHSFVYLIGCAAKKEGKWVIVQFLAQHISEEKALIAAFFDYARSFSRLVHFNGDRFDVPYIDYKAAAYGLDFRLGSMANYDLLKSVRASKNLTGMQKLNQKSVECFLKISREDEMSGGELISWYFEYQKSGDARLEKYLLLHNYDDMQGMLKISPITAYEDINRKQFDISAVRLSEKQLEIDCALKAPVPRAFEKTGPHFTAEAQEAFLRLAVDTYCGQACYYFEDYKNYYYLPDEDRAIHKDLAKFVDRDHRIKATRKNCYIKKEAVFLPQKGTLFTPCFYLPEGKEAFFEAGQAGKADSATVREYVLEFLGR